MPKLTFGSLFAGIGGFDLGFERAGMECRWQVEIDEYANRVLAKHWPNVRRWPDVRTWPQPDTERVDVICGGFPCQDISYAGKGAGLAGERSGLFYELARIVREMGPRIVVLENVAALLTRGLDDVLGTLAALGYDAEWHVFSACSLGAPHMRERLFIIAHASKERWNGSGKCTNGKHAVHSRLNPWKTAPRGVWGDVVCWAREIMETGNGILPASERGRVVDGIPHRLDRIACCGNAVVPQVAEWIGRRIVEACD